MTTTFDHRLGSQPLAARRPTEVPPCWGPTVGGGSAVELVIGENGVQFPTKAPVGLPTIGEDGLTRRSTAQGQFQETQVYRTLARAPAEYHAATWAVASLKPNEPSGRAMTLM